MKPLAMLGLAAVAGMCAGVPTPAPTPAPAPASNTAYLDIKPGSCPNSFNRTSQGVLPVALLGTDTFDVTDVDIDSLLLSRADGVGGSVAPHEGPPGPHTVVDDVASVFEGEPCECTEDGADGYDDLAIKFKSRDVADELDLDDFERGDTVELTLSGTLIDGTAFEADDCIRIVK
jgi:hypothetical protein